MTRVDFEQNVLPLKNRLFRLGFSLLKSEDDALDLVQDAFVKLWSQRNQLDEVQNIESWSVTITRNLALDRLRSGKYKSEELSELHLNTKQEDSSAAASEARDAIGKLQQWLHQLPEKQRTVFHLRDFEQRSYKEISEILQMEESAVKVNLFRARKSMKEKLEKAYAYGLQ